MRFSSVDKENIHTSIKDLKEDVNQKISDLKEDVNQKITNNQQETSKHFERLEKKQDKHNNLIERMAIVEQSTKSAHHRIDSIEGGNRGNISKRN